MKKIFDDKTVERLNGFEVDLPADDWGALLAKMPAKRGRAIPLWRYAVAASVVVLLGLGTFIIFFQQNNYEYRSFVSKTQSQYPTDAACGTDCPNRIAEKVTSQSGKRTTNIQRTPINDADLGNQTLDKLKSGKVKVRSVKPHGKKRNIAISPAQNTESGNTYDTGASTDEKIYNSNKPTSDQNRKLPTPDENKSLDDYKRENTSTPKEDAKQQRRNFKDKHSLTKNYYASAYSSLSPLSGGGISKNSSGAFRSTNGYGAVSSPYYSHTTHNIPISFGVSAGLPLIADKLYINTGIKYTFLYSSTATRDKSSHVAVSLEEQRLHYIGIPVSVSYQFLNTGAFKFYFGGGLTLDKGIVNNQKYTSYVFNGEGSHSNTNGQIKGIMASLNAKAGVAYRLIRTLDVYVEPLFAWYIPNTKHQQPTSKITESPLTVNVTGGLRWNF